MPYYHGHGMQTHLPRANRLPLTPPEVWGNGTQHLPHYGVIGQSYYDQSVQDQLNAGFAKRPTRHEYDFPPVSAPIHSQYRGQEYGFESQIPTLPPIRTYDLDRQLQPMTQAMEEPQEEKVAGGVASTLTYKMEQMVDFVSEMATVMHDLHRQNFQFKDIDVCRSLQPNNASVTPAFRKYVSQVLTSTRLPISTIMLALNYLAMRMEIIQNSPGALQANLFQMLTTALMLASKFLDDNTFQNRSWAEVSHVPVADLNKHEVAWLIDMKWHLHFDVDAEFKTWLQAYERYAEAKKVRQIQSSMDALKLNHVEMRQPQATRYLPQTPLYTPPSHHEASFGQTRERPNPWQQWVPPRTISPPSAGPSFPSTPAEWFKNPSSGFGQHSMAFSSRPVPPLQILPSNQSPYYGNNYSQYTPAWSSHPIGCHCCHRSADYNRFGLHQGYGVSSIA